MSDILAALLALPFFMFNANPVGGTLVAAVLTTNQIILCSDGRVVSAADGSVIREDWSKVHRLTDRVGLLSVGHPAS